MKYDHIPLEEMLKDLKDTNDEIEQYQSQINTLKQNHLENRTQIYLLQGRILHREEFVSQLKDIIKQTYPNHQQD